MRDTFLLPILVMLGLTVVPLWFFNQYEVKQEAEILKNGKEYSALIIEKFEDVTEDVFMVTPAPMMIPGNEEYVLRLYANEKNYDIQVSESLYKDKNVGNYLDIKLYKDKIEILE